MAMSKGEVETGNIFTGPLEPIRINHALAPDFRASKGLLIVPVSLQIVKITGGVVNELQVADLVLASLTLEVKGGRVGVVVVDDLGSRHGADGADATNLIEHGLDDVVHGIKAVAASPPYPRIILPLSRKATPFWERSGDGHFSVTSSIHSANSWASTPRLYPMISQRVKTSL